MHEGLVSCCLYFSFVMSFQQKEVVITNNFFFVTQRSLVAGKETESASDEDAIADLMENHQDFLTAGQSRLTKLQVIATLHLPELSDSSILVQWRF
jgi:hypothetical protein